MGCSVRAGVCLQDAATEIKGHRVNRHIELHTATQAHRLADPTEALSPASMDLIVAAINRHLRKQAPNAAALPRSHADPPPCQGHKRGRPTCPVPRGARPPRRACWAGR